MSWTFIVRAAASALMTLSLFAAGSARAAPPAGTTFDDWAVECETGPDGATRCFLSQVQLLRENNARLLKASVGYPGPAAEPFLVLLLPLGVDLRAGIALKLDDAPQISLAYQQCLQEGCTAALQLDGQTLAALRKAERIQVGIKPYGSAQIMTIKISPEGLARGMDALR
ncbi:invasion associated locus B family protein [Indioceanicola profundi]|uniref:invasion associated locus B family protein n=1 Tax=Indioceanicola profundi TaxID=2220096 RepID=UPI0013C4182D|nr:invasion associated locus B family protein [Indioceanicola profundi]